MEKIYVGRTTEAQNKFGEQEVNIGFTAEDITKLQENLNEKGWVNLVLKKSKEGKPYLQVNTWSGKSGGAAVRPVTSQDASEAVGLGGDQDELPF